MISDTVLRTLESYVPRENIFLGEPMSRHTTFRIGGEADCFVEIESAEQLTHLKRYLQGWCSMWDPGCSRFRYRGSA